MPMGTACPRLNQREGGRIVPDRINESFRAILPWVATIVLSCWGGTVAYITKNRKRQFRMRDLMFDLVVSSFAGIMMHLLCSSAGLNQRISAVLIAISGHMGTRAIASFEKFRDRMFGGDNVQS